MTISRLSLVPDIFMFGAILKAKDRMEATLWELKRLSLRWVEETYVTAVRAKMVICRRHSLASKPTLEFYSYMTFDSKDVGIRF